MGTDCSKFRKALENGEEQTAMDLYYQSRDVIKNINPNVAYGQSTGCNTPLHYACKYGMNVLIKNFLELHGGNPNKSNLRAETCLHLICMADNSNDVGVPKTRADCLQLLLNWRGPLLAIGDREKINVLVVDKRGNSALHYAAMSGLQTCVEILLQHGAPLFLESAENMTPCDLAEKYGHHVTARFLETKMVFNSECRDSTDEHNVSIITPNIDKNVEPYAGLKAQEIIEAKDRLIVETADMLNVTLSTAEVLLRNHEWSRQNLIDAWFRDPYACCEASGVPSPSHVTIDIVDEGPPLSPVSLTRRTTLADACHSDYNTTIQCAICVGDIDLCEETVCMQCEHNFCRTCWNRYLTGKIDSGHIYTILCPGAECLEVVPNNVIEKVVSPATVRRYQQFDIEAFVDSNPNIKWCPSPGCERAVKLPEERERSLEQQTASSTPPTSISVDCGNGHYFCWDCLEDGHEPCSCDNWKKWEEKMKSSECKDMESASVQTVKSEEADKSANCLWLVTNSKPCPNCHSPIQKNEGCNHMICTKCKFEFCWVCLEAWKKHSSATGGYFTCNRFEIVGKVKEKTSQLIVEARVKNDELQEKKRFIHYYSRYRNHGNSYRLEEVLLTTAREKIDALLVAVLNSSADTPGTSCCLTGASSADISIHFLEDAVKELLRSRKVLSASYAYGYYLSFNDMIKETYEFMQNEFERAVEALSQMVCRPYLKTPQSKIIQATQVLQRKRRAFLTSVSNGLSSSDVSPASRRRKNFHGLNITVDPQEDSLATLRALHTSLMDLAPADGWLMDSSGLHNYIPLLYDVVDMEDYDMVTRPPEPGEPESTDECMREGCNRPKAYNSRSKCFNQFCSLRCIRLYREARLRQTDTQPSDTPGDSNIDTQRIDLMRAMEMSILLQQAQILESSCLPNQSTLSLSHTADQSDTPSTSRQSDTDGSRVSVSEEGGQAAVDSTSDVFNPSEEVDLNYAIELSLRESHLNHASLQYWEQGVGGHHDDGGADRLFPDEMTDLLAQTEDTNNNYNNNNTTDISHFHTQPEQLIDIVFDEAWTIPEAASSERGVIEGPVGEEEGAVGEAPVTPPDPPVVADDGEEMWTEVEQSVITMV